MSLYLSIFSDSAQNTDFFPQVFRLVIIFHSNLLRFLIQLLQKCIIVFIFA